MKNIMQQMQSMQKKMADMQAKMAATEYQGTSGGGLVTVTVNGKKELIKLKISPTLLVADEVEILEDLIIASIADATKKADDSSEGGNVSSLWEYTTSAWI